MKLMFACKREHLLGLITKPVQSLERNQNMFRVFYF